MSIMRRNKIAGLCLTLFALLVAKYMATSYWFTLSAWRWCNRILGGLSWVSWIVFAPLFILFYGSSGLFRAIVVHLFPWLPSLVDEYTNSGLCRNIGGEIILITGGGRGLGRHLAIALARKKPKHIILWGRTKKPLEIVCDLIKFEHKDVNCSYMLCDVGVREQVEKQAEVVRTNIGDVTILINNAGVVHADEVLNTSPEDIQHTFHTNTFGQIWCIRAFLPAMQAHNNGHIVSINSMLGVMGLNGAAEYSASKFALSGYMESLEMELSRRKNNNVLTTSIHPYLIDAPMFAGCRASKFPWLFPPLTNDFVTERIVNAIQNKESVVFIPRFMVYMDIVKAILPRSCFMCIQKNFGVLEAMDNFHGRRRQMRVM